MIDGYDSLVAEIEKAISSNSFQRADLAIRALLKKEPSSIELHLLFADLARTLGRWSIHADARARAALLGAEVPVQHDFTDPARQGGHLLITEWGQGFWSDVAHVLGSLLLSEMTGRTPTVHWSGASLFSPEDGNNAWDRFFEPVGPSRQELPRSASYFPDPWDFGAAQSERLCQVRERRPAGSYGIGLLPRQEDVVVSDTYVGVSDLWPWLEPTDIDFGTSMVETKRRLATKYLRLQPHLAGIVDTIWSQNMSGRKWLAVHIRGSDKTAELENLAEVNTQYPQAIDEWLAQNKDGAVFLMTDSIPHYFDMRARYGHRLLVLNAIRTQGVTGVHFAGHNPVQVAEQVLLDTFLATKCHAFLGNGTSNVSLAIEYLKNWEEGSYRLLGPDRRESRFTL